MSSTASSSYLTSKRFNYLDNPFYYIDKELEDNVEPKNQTKPKIDIKKVLDLLLPLL